MRRLLLLRHAKAAPPAGGDDHERALTDRGREDGRRIGDLIAARGLVPDLLI
jgi:phosphohistidine phosphatase